MNYIAKFIDRSRRKGFADTIVHCIHGPVRRMQIERALASQQRKCIESLDSLNIADVRARTLAFVESMRIHEQPYGQWGYSCSSRKPVLYASIYALLIKHLYGELGNLPRRYTQEWTNYIESFQSEDGLFRDPAVTCEIAENVDWWGWRHLTLHALMGLAALGKVAPKKLKILKPFEDKDYLINWLRTRNWESDPAHVSNEIQNWGTMLQYARDFQGQDWADRALRAIYEFLDEIQDRNTGLWGNNFDTPKNLSIGVQTGYHFWCLYFYDSQPVNYREKIVDTCLKTQSKLYGFGVSANSSACEDIDSIDPLARLYSQIDHHRKDVIAALEGALSWVLVNMNEDGGFVFRRAEPFIYGHRNMSSKADESAMFPTWFRTLSLAYIGKVLNNSSVGKFEWRFLDCPGLQFWKDRR